jgi:hypothetical protein
VTDEADRSQCLSPQQAYEVAYRFMARYYDLERTVALLRFLQGMAWAGAGPESNEDGWAVWQACVQQTLDGAPLPELPPPWDQ